MCTIKLPNIGTVFEVTVFFGVITKFNIQISLNYLMKIYLADSNILDIFIICMSFKILNDIVCTLLLFAYDYLVF